MTEIYRNDESPTVDWEEMKPGDCFYVGRGENLRMKLDDELMLVLYKSTDNEYKINPQVDKYKKINQRTLYMAEAVIEWRKS